MCSCAAILSLCLRVRMKWCKNWLVNRTVAFFGEGPNENLYIFLSNESFVLFVLCTWNNPLSSNSTWKLTQNEHQENKSHKIYINLFYYFFFLSLIFFFFRTSIATICKLFTFYFTRLVLCFINSIIFAFGCTQISFVNKF